MADKTKTQEQREKLYKQVVEDLLPWKAAQLPNMGNATPSLLVDQVGRMKQMEKDCKAVAETLQSVLDSKLTEEEKKLPVRGEQYERKLVPASQTRISADKAREVITRLANQLRGLAPEGSIAALKTPADYIAEASDTIDMTQRRFSEL